MDNNRRWGRELLAVSKDRQIGLLSGRLRCLSATLRDLVDQFVAVIVIRGRAYLRRVFSGTPPKRPTDRFWRAAGLGPRDLRDIAWAANGRSLFALALRELNNLIVEIGLDGKTHVILDQGKNHAVYSLSPSTDGHHIAFSRVTWESNAWLLEHF
jgi:hypothetical protein